MRRRRSSGRFIARQGAIHRWRTGQVVALLALAGLTAILSLSPGDGLILLWAGVIPALPILWLLHPGLWRNVCPVASINMAVARYGMRRRLGRSASLGGGIVGLAGFALLVPARPSLFNQNAHAVLVALAICVSLACIGGLLLDRKAGFCNTLCPMLAVERLYGQSPLVRVANPRCPRCTGCTMRGCLDLRPRASQLQVLGRSVHDGRWILRAHGAFAAALPGFVVGYFVSPDPSAPWMYASTAVGALASWAMTAAFVRITHAPAPRVLAALAMTAFVAFCWFGTVDVAEAWGGGALATWALRGGALVCAAVWIARRGRGAARRALRR